jgi:tRNA-splicing ligase RtcB
MHTITTERIPITVWGDVEDEKTLAQARNLANLPLAFHHVALMADAHVGYGMPIGGVLATRGQIIPHAVGLDIGCGVRGWGTNIPLVQLAPHRDAILHEIMRAVPQGFEWHKGSQSHRTELFDDVPDVPALRAELDKAAKQLGTLGGGNHFIELQAEDAGTSLREDDSSQDGPLVWAMVHSGSRNVGKQMAEHYDTLAREDNARRNSDVPRERGLAHLDVGSGPGAEYLEVMQWCMRFAKESRRLMAEATQSAIAQFFPDVRPAAAIDVHHNYAAIETHYGERVVVHRKGAVRAEETVLIPGSMGTATYVGQGNCNPESFCSCSHGAGRAMGRKAAKRELSRDHVLAGLAEADIKLAKAKKGDVAEEAPEAYKDIEEVMRSQHDLVEPILRLRPIGVVKG